MRVLIPVDLAARDALPSLFSAASAVSRGDEVHVLYVLPVDPYGGLHVVSENLRRHAQLRERLAELAVHAGLGRAIVHVRHGLSSVGLEVAEYARNRGIGRIVIPSHHRQGVARWLWGSVAAEIDREVTIPVALVPIRPPLSVVGSEAHAPGA